MAFHINPDDSPDNPGEPPVNPEEPANPEQSPVAPSVPGRYGNGYRTARLRISAGKIFMYWLCWIYGLYHILLPLLNVRPFSAPYGPSPMMTSMVWMQLVPALYEVVYTWALGLLLVGIGHILTGILDTATRSAPAPSPTYATPV